MICLWSKWRPSQHRRAFVWRAGNITAWCFHCSCFWSFWLPYPCPPAYITSESITFKLYMYFFPPFKSNTSSESKIINKYNEHRKKLILFPLYITLTNNNSFFDSKNVKLLFKPNWLFFDIFRKQFSWRNLIKYIKIIKI